MPIVKRIHFKLGAFQDGLSRDLGTLEMTNHAVFVGPNGAGKTRLLRRVLLALRSALEKSRGKINYTDNIFEDDHFVVEFSPDISPADICLIDIWEPISWSKLANKYEHGEVNDLTDRLYTDPNEFHSFQKNALGYILGITHEHLARVQPNVIQSRGRELSRFDRLSAQLQKTLGVGLTFDSSGNARLFGRPLGLLEESTGQRKLIQFSAAASTFASVDRPVIMLLDEIEVNLHPGAAIALIDDLLQTFSSLQLLIATHSLQILAHLGLASGWSVDKGTVSPIRSGPDSVVQSLFGGSENLEKFRALIEEPAKVALAAFAAEGLVVPKSVSFKGGDPQCWQTMEQLKARLASIQEPLRVLDFGAGRGRLASSLSRFIQGTPGPGVDYVAFDVNESAKDECVAAIKLIHPTDYDRRYYSRVSDLIRDRVAERPFDVIVMCNLLHEVHPKDWATLLWEDSAKDLLADNGVVMIVEDLRISHGEKAYHEGFLLLDPTAIRLLFDKPTDGFSHSFSPEAKYRDRLVVYVLGRHIIKRMTMETIGEANANNCKSSQQSQHHYCCIL